METIYLNSKDEKIEMVEMKTAHLLFAIAKNSKYIGLNTRQFDTIDPEGCARKERENKGMHYEVMRRKEYTPVRRFYAVIGFISIICGIGIVLYSLVMSINYINHNTDEYVPPSSLLGEIEELRAVAIMREMVIEKAYKVIDEQKVWLFLKDEKIDEMWAVLEDQDSAMADQSALLKRQDVLIKDQGALIEELTPWKK